MKKSLDWINKNKVLFGLSLVLVVLVIVPLMVYGLSVGTVFPNGGNDWSGFWGGYLGAIIGAAAAVFGVVVTLNETRRQTKVTLEETRQQFKEDKRIEHAPLLKITEVEHGDDKDDGDIQYILDEDYDKKVLKYLCFKNIGLGIATCFEVSDVNFVNGIGEKCENFSLGSGMYCNEAFEVGDTYTFPVEVYFKLPVYDKNCDIFSDPIRLRCGQLSFNLIYSDIFENKYKQNVVLSLGMNNDRTQECINDITFRLSVNSKIDLI